MAIKVASRITDAKDRAVSKVYNRHGEGYSSNKVCVFWLAGKCNRNPCRFLHRHPHPLTYNRNSKQSHVSPEDSLKGSSKLSPMVSMSKNGATGIESTLKNQQKVTQKIKDRICEDWLSNNCVYGDKCRYLHSWFRGDQFTWLTQLEGHKKAITGIALPSGSDKLYSGCADGSVRVWDCNTSKCVNVINVGGEVGSLISEGPWVFVGMPNVVKAITGIALPSGSDKLYSGCGDGTVRVWDCNTGQCANVINIAGKIGSLISEGPWVFVGMQNVKLQDGAILAWKSGTETNPFHLAGALMGHELSLFFLAVGGDMLYSGSMDHTIRVWNIDALQCVQKLNGHSDAVMSLLCWDQFLLSCSLDGTIKVWVATESGSFKVTYTHNEEHGVLALCGIHDAEVKSILFSCCNDNSVRLYDLPSFSDRGRLFSKKEVRAIQIGPGGIFFTGDGTGRLVVWKWLAESSAVAS